MRLVLVQIIVSSLCNVFKKKIHRSINHTSSKQKVWINRLKGIDKKANRFPNYFLMRQLLVNDCDEILDNKAI